MASNIATNTAASTASDTAFVSAEPQQLDKPGSANGKPEQPCTFEVRPWHDPVLDSIGVEPLSPYVEKFWSGILGPSATLLLRRLSTELAHHPEGFTTSSTALATELGLGMRNGRQGPFWRCLYRAERFGVLQRHAHVLLVRTQIAPLTTRQTERLPDHLKKQHGQWLNERAARSPQPETLSESGR